MVPGVVILVVVLVVGVYGFSRIARTTQASADLSQQLPSLIRALESRIRDLEEESERADGRLERKLDDRITPLETQVRELKGKFQ